MLLFENPRSYVPGVGDKSTAKYIIVAEQPGRQEVLQRTPMVGPAGENLNECLRDARISRRDCYITNVIKDLDYDLSHYIDLRKKKSPIQPMGKAYLDVLKYELSKTSKEAVIIPMGNVALYALTGRIGISNWRGSVMMSTLLPNRICVPTFHPATWTGEKLFRDPKLTLNRVLVIYDLQRAKEQVGHTEIQKHPRHVIIRPTAAEAIAYLEECKKHTLVFYDIELLNNEMSCISFSYKEEEAICIPFVDGGGQFYSLREERDIMLKISEVLEDERITKGGQNIIFDSHFIHSKYGILTVNRQDTMIAQGILYPEFPKRLKFITSLWTDMNFYKDDGKIWLEGGSDWDNGFIYNGLDSIACAASFHKQLAELEKTNNLDAYQRQVDLVEPLTYMMEHGVRVDIAGFGRAILNNTLQQAEKYAEIRSYMGDVNPGSPIQLMDYFYNKKDIEPIRNKKKRVTTDESALIELASKGHTEAQLILDWRELNKLGTTYLNMNKIDRDGRLRCSYNPVGTSYGRISSSRNIYGTGMNLQNLPMNIRTFLVADQGYVIYSLDLSQAENRLVAYIGNILPMIRVFEEGRDLHKLTASLIFKVPYDEVTDEQRYEGKRSNHGFNYGWGATAFARKYQVSIDYARFIRCEYHKAYPEVENNYWAYVQNELRNNRMTLTTLFGRKIRFFQKYGPEMLNAAYSAIPQGTVGELINERGIKYVYYNEDPIFDPVEILTQTHDSIDFQIPLSLGVKQHADIILQVIKSLEEPLRFHQRQISIPCDLVVNTNLNKKTGVEIKSAKMPKTIDGLIPIIENSIDQLGVKFK